MTSEARVKAVYPDAYCVREGGTTACHMVYVPIQPKGRRLLGGAFGDRRRAWAEAARKVAEMPRPRFQVGDRVSCNGRPGTVQSIDPPFLTGRGWAYARYRVAMDEDGPSDRAGTYSEDTLEPCEGDRP